MTNLTIKDWLTQNAQGNLSQQDIDTKIFSRIDSNRREIEEKFLLPDSKKTGSSQKTKNKKDPHEKDLTWVKQALLNHYTTNKALLDKEQILLLGSLFEKSQFNENKEKLILSEERDYETLASLIAVYDLIKKRHQRGALELFDIEFNFKATSPTPIKLLVELLQRNSINSTITSKFRQLLLLFRAQHVAPQLIPLIEAAPNMSSKDYQNYSELIEEVQNTQKKPHRQRTSKNHTPVKQAISQRVSSQQNATANLTHSRENDTSKSFKQLQKSAIKEIEAHYLQTHWWISKDRETCAKTLISYLKAATNTDDLLDAVERASQAALKNDQKAMSRHWLRVRNQKGSRFNNALNRIRRRIYKKQAMIPPLQAIKNEAQHKINHYLVSMSLAHDRKRAAQQLREGLNNADSFDKILDHLNNAHQQILQDDTEADQHTWFFYRNTEGSRLTRLLNDIRSNCWEVITDPKSTFDTDHMDLLIQKEFENVQNIIKTVQKRNLFTTNNTIYWAMTDLLNSEPEDFKSKYDALNNIIQELNFNFPPTRENSDPTERHFIELLKTRVGNLRRFIFNSNNSLKDKIMNDPKERLYSECQHAFYHTLHSKEILNQPAVRKKLKVANAYSEVIEPVVEKYANQTRNDGITVDNNDKQELREALHKLIVQLNCHIKGGILIDRIHIEKRSNQVYTFKMDSAIDPEAHPPQFYQLQFEFNLNTKGYRVLKPIEMLSKQQFYDRFFSELAQFAPSKWHRLINNSSFREEAFKNNYSAVFELLTKANDQSNLNDLNKVNFVQLIYRYKELEAFLKSDVEHIKTFLAKPLHLPRDNSEHTSCFRTIHDGLCWKLINALCKKTKNNDKVIEVLNEIKQDNPYIETFISKMNDPNEQDAKPNNELQEQSNDQLQKQSKAPIPTHQSPHQDPVESDQQSMRFTL